jgi:nitroreductase
MDLWLAMASRREVRDYAGTPIPEEVELRILDAGRCAANMLLAAWDQGVGSCPNGMPDADPVAELLGLGEDERPAIVLTFGYPARPRDPSSRPAEEWSARATRKPLVDLIERI